MSNRTLIEINHDYCAEIKANPTQFMKAIVDRINSGGHADTEIWPGVRAIAQRHHSDPYYIQWGGREETNRSAQRRAEFTWEGLRPGQVYERRDGRIVRVLTIGGGPWGYVQYENVNRTGRQPPQGKKSAHYFVGDIKRLIPDAAP